MGFYIDAVKDGRTERIAVQSPMTGHEVISLVGCTDKRSIIAWRVNRILRPLSWMIDDDSEVEFVDASTFEGMEIYRRSLIFVLVLACKRILGRELHVRYSMNDSYFCEFQDGVPVTEADVATIKACMQNLIDLDLPISREVLPLDKARRIFERQGNPGKARLLAWSGADPVALYRCTGVYGHFGGPLVASTSALRTFDVVAYEPGLLLRYPAITAPEELPQHGVVSKLMDVFNEYKTWLSVLGLSTMDSLHERVSQGRALDVILVSEAFHSEALARVSREVMGRGGVRLLCLAGPSSSGKTTTSKRLAIQLQVSGLQPVTLELDSYYVERKNTPRDEMGNYDFEALEALDLELLNEHLEALLAGEEVQIPRYDFTTGTRKPGRTLHLRAGDILIIEGIHGLNDKISEFIPNELKYKVFISPLTGVNIDTHTRIGTTDTRLLRRMVRDHRRRGYSPESTILMWPSVIKGSHKHIFPYEEGADYLFNTSLAYELSVLKGYAEPMLRAIPESSPAYGDSSRLLSMLSYVPVIPSENVPNLSILREFIGGSCFDD